MGPAARARRDAARQLADIAGRWPNLDVDLVLARPASLRVLHRHALAAADRDQLAEVHRLHAVAAGDTTALHDAIHHQETAP